MRNRLLRQIARSNSRPGYTPAPAPPLAPAIPFEPELRSWLRARDPGDAPIKLHLDVAKISDTGDRSGGQRGLILGLASGAASIAVLAWIAAISIVQPALPPHQPAASTTPTLDPTYFSGPWPTLGPVLAIPEPIALVGLVLAALLIAMIGVREAELGRLLRGRGRPAGTRRRRIRRLLARVLTPVFIVALVPVGFAVTREPLANGGLAGTNSPLFLGWYRQTLGGSNELEFTYEPGGEIRTALSLTNDGADALTVLGVDWESSGVFESATLRLPPAETMSSVPGYPTSDWPYWGSEPFRPFVIGPGGTLTTVLSIGLRRCAGQAGVPIPSNTGDPFANYMPPERSPKAYAAGVPIRYSVNGIEHRTVVRLMAVVAVVGAPGRPMGC